MRVRFFPKQIPISLIPPLMLACGGVAMVNVSGFDSTSVSVTHPVMFERISLT